MKWINPLPPPPRERYSQRTFVTVGAILAVLLWVGLVIWVRSHRESSLGLRAAALPANHLAIFLWWDAPPFDWIASEVFLHGANAVIYALTGGLLGCLAWRVPGRFAARHLLWLVTMVALLLGLCIVIADRFAAPISRVGD